MFKKIITFYLIGLMATIVSLSSVEPTAQEIKEETVLSPKSTEFISQDKGFSIVIPEKWETKELKEFGLDILVLIPPDTDEGLMHERITVIYAKLEGGADLEKFYNLSIENLEEAITDFKMEEFSDVKLKNVEAKKILYSDKQISDDIKILQYFVVHKNNVYIITCSADGPEYPRFKDIYEAVAKSFRVLD